MYCSEQEINVIPQMPGPVLPKQSGQPPIDRQKNDQPVWDPPDWSQKIVFVAARTRHRLPQFEDHFA